MNIELKNIPIRDLVDGYENNQEAGVVGFGGRLDIRPPYQREFVYNEKQQKAVIDTITKKFPLNTMYWAVTNEGFEIIDGQQRTMSICQYVKGNFVYDGRYFHNLLQDEKNAFLDYEITVYWCSGSDSERLAWFRTINIAGEELTDQELRNAVYAGDWTADAKHYFSKTRCPAWELANKYMRGAPIRQDFLETAISWINDGNVDEYMAMHQHDKSANPLWLYFQTVINWVATIFPQYRKEMKGVSWGELYNEFKDGNFDPHELEKEIIALMVDEDVTNKKGIYSYIFDKDEKHLNIRSFDNSQKREVYEKQEGICPICNEAFDLDEMEADHIIPWHEGGRTNIDNCQMLCKKDNRRKAGR